MHTGVLLEIRIGSLEEDLDPVKRGNCCLSLWTRRSVDRREQVKNQAYDTSCQSTSDSGANGIVDRTFVSLMGDSGTHKCPATLCTGCSYARSGGAEESTKPKSRKPWNLALHPRD